PAQESGTKDEGRRRGRQRRTDTDRECWRRSKPFPDHGFWEAFGKRVARRVSEREGPGAIRYPAISPDFDSAWTIERARNSWVHTAFRPGSTRMACSAVPSGCSSGGL